MILCKLFHYEMCELEKVLRIQIQIGWIGFESSSRIVEKDISIDADAKSLIFGRWTRDGWHDLKVEGVQQHTHRIDRDVGKDECRSRQRTNILDLRNPRWWAECRRRWARAGRWSSCQCRMPRHHRDHCLVCCHSWSRCYRGGLKNFA